MSEQTWEYEDVLIKVNHYLDQVPLSTSAPRDYCSEHRYLYLLRDALTQLRTEVKWLKESDTSLRVERDRNIKEMDSLRTENKRLEKDIVKLEADLDEADTDNARLTRERDAWKWIARELSDLAGFDFDARLKEIGEYEPDVAIILKGDTDG